MLPEALIYEAQPQHLNGKREQKYQRVQLFRFKIFNKQTQPQF